MQAPLYKNAQASLAKPDKAHAGLWFERFFNGYDREWTVAADAKQTWIKSVTGKQGDVAKLADFASRQQALVSVLQGESRFYKTDWHFVTGMGNPHPVENGFTWHPTLAVPFLAGSAVKGLVRSWVEMDEDGLGETEKKARLKQWFGTEDKKDVAEQAGNFIFFDALPNEPPVLLCDIMTPHMGKWYEQGDTGSLNPDVIPADWHEPVPVPFLAVKKAQFVFSIAARHPENKEHVDELKKVFEALDNALTWLGAGAKTAAGYGYMEETNQSKQLREERTQQQTKDATDAQLALLNEAGRALFLLREAVKKDPKPTLQGSLRELLTKAIKQAETENWSTAEKQALLEIGNALNSVWKADKLKKQLKTLQ
jgi:CRISPR-associated protein Cmr6